jgi:hypothetical protein
MRNESLPGDEPQTPTAEPQSRCKHCRAIVSIYWYDYAWRFVTHDVLFGSEDGPVAGICMGSGDEA